MNLREEMTFESYKIFQDNKIDSIFSTILRREIDKIALVVQWIEQVPPKH